MSETQPIGTCVILTNSQNEILLGRRKNSYKAGMYGLPGGRIEVGEPIVSAVAREVEEETGLVDLAFTFVGVVKENQGEYDFIHFVFTAQISEQQPQLREPDKCEGWEWLSTSADLSSVLPGHKAGIELFLSGENVADITEGVASPVARH